MTIHSKSHAAYSCTPVCKSENKETNMQHISNRCTASKGFTMVEVIITMAIIAILAGVGWPMFERQMARQQVSDAIITLTTIETQMAKCLLDNGIYAGCTPCGTTDGPSIDGNYKITVKCDAGLNAYTATATPNSTAHGQEALALSSLGHKIGPWP